MTEPASGDSEEQGPAAAERSSASPVSRWLSPMMNFLVGTLMLFPQSVEDPILKPVAWTLSLLLLSSFLAWLAKKEWSFYLVDIAVGISLLTELFAWAQPELQGGLTLDFFLFWIVFLLNRSLHSGILRERAEMENEQPGSSKG